MIAVELTSDARDVLDRFNALPNAMLRTMATALDLENQLTVGHIVSTKLSQRGPKTLGVVTNRLRGSSRASKTEIKGSELRGGIGTNVPYAGVHEYGYKGTVQIPAHRRRSPQGDRFTVGTALVSRRLATALGAFGKGGRPRKNVKQVSSGLSYVKAHSRKVDFPERAMFRTGISERTAHYGTALSRAIVEAWEKL